MARENKIKKAVQGATPAQQQSTDIIFTRKDVNEVEVTQIDQSKPETLQAVEEAKKKIAAYQDPELVRKTYYYTNQLIKAIALMAVVEEKDKSQVVRELLLESRLKEYMK